MSASMKAQATKEANLALVADLLPLPYDVQATRVMALRPTTRIGQVGKQLGKALLIEAKYIDKTPEEKAAFKASLPDFLKHQVDLILRGAIPHSGTKKKSVSAYNDWGNIAYNEEQKEKKAAAAASHSPRAAAEAEPSELDKRIKVFRQTGLLFSYLYELTGEEEDREGSQNYGNYTIKAKGDDSDEHLVVTVTAIEEGDEEGRPLAIKALRKLFQDRVAHAITHLRGLLKDRKMTLHKVVADIKRHLGPIAVNIDLAELDNKLALDTYMSMDERHKLAVLLTRSEFGAYTQKAAVLASLLEFLELIRKRLALRKNHGKTRKSQYGLKSKSASANANAAEKVYLKKQMTILGKQDLTWAQKQNALRSLTNERKAYFGSVPFTTPFRDMKGFKQHDAECSTDVISQIIVQGVPWAATIQERLYNGTVAEFKTMYDKTLACPGIHPSEEDMMALLLTMQERFKLHYTAAKKLEEAAACVQPFDYSKIGPILTRKVRKSAELGPSVKKNVKTLIKGLDSSTTAYVTYIFQLLFQFFGYNDILCYKRRLTHKYRSKPTLYTFKDIQYRGFQHLAFVLRLNHYRPKDVTLFLRPEQDIAGHYSAIYKSLDGLWVFYDNEVGVLPLHPQLMKDILNERIDSWFIGFTYTKIANSSAYTINFYKIPYFQITDLARLRSQVIEVWIGDRWMEMEFEDIASMSRISVTIETIHIVSKKMEEPGFEALYMDDA